MVIEPLQLGTRTRVESAKSLVVSASCLVLVRSTCSNRQGSYMMENDYTPHFIWAINVTNSLSTNCFFLPAELQISIILRLQVAPEPPPAAPVLSKMQRYLEKQEMGSCLVLKKTWPTKSDYIILLYVFNI